MNEIIPIVMDSTFNRIAALDNYKTFIWTTRYYEHGDFQIETAVNPETVAILQTGNYIVRTDDDNVGIIEKIDITVSESDERVLKISGRFLTQILARRIIAEQTQLDGTLSDSINQLITDAIINPDIISRKISNFILGTYEFDDHVEVQYTGKNLYTVISDLAVQYKIGFRVIMDAYEHFIFELYKGIDRSYNQSIHPYVVFSDEYENLINAEYQKDCQGIVTAVLAAGEGEGADRKTIWVESESQPSGLGRYEVYDDARNVSSNDGEITEQDYYNQLAEGGRASLTSYETTFGGEVNFNSVKFKEDVNIGDLVTIENKSLGLTLTARIIEVIESIDASGAYSIIPTFGT